MSETPGSVPTLESLIYYPVSYFQPLVLPGLFAQARPLEVELGSGDGSFLVTYAKAHPECNFLGVERLLGRLRKIDRKGQRAKLVNMRVMRIEASYFLEYLLPANSVSALHVYFPDPWPKRKHRKHRLVNSRFTELACRVLEQRGMVYLRTDDADYFAQMTEVFGASRDFVAMGAPPSLVEVRTDFEREFNRRGTPTLSATYQRNAPE